MVRFDPPPADVELPARLLHPFSLPPHPLARRAAEALKEELRAGRVPGVDLASLERPGLGKMFGVLVALDEEGRVGFLRGFSGMLDGKWRVEGFVPPLFDQQEKDAFWPALEEELNSHELRHAELSGGEEVTRLREEVAALRRHHGGVVAAIRAQHGRSRGRRQEERAEDPAQRERLDQESREESAELRKILAGQARELNEGSAPLRELEERLATLEKTRADRSRESWLRLTDTYRLANARGETRTVTELFAPQPPPGGAGDCAGPKLLGYAYRHRLRPLAFAEFWWGAPTPSGDRRPGEFYPACQTKCGVVVPFMLLGLDVEPAPLVVAPEQGLRILYEDEHLLAVEKPAGLPSSPGRRPRDSLLTRLQSHCPTAALVYSLEPDESGVVLAGKQRSTVGAMQRQLGTGAALRVVEGSRTVELRLLHPVSGMLVVIRGPVAPADDAGARPGPSTEVTSDEMTPRNISS